MFDPLTTSTPLDEFSLIKRYFSPPSQHALLAGGDDCALLQTPSDQILAVTTDMLVAGRHFFVNTDAARLGHKALAVNLSDLAAMAAKPYAFTLSLALPAIDEDWLSAFSRGMLNLARQYHCELIGGDTTRGPLTISITALGHVTANTTLRRDAAQIDDDIWVSGELGDAHLALEVLLRESSAIAKEVAVKPHDLAQIRLRLEQPQPRVALGLALRTLAHAAIDISDGLISDLGHVLARSHCGATIQLAALPRSLVLAQQKESVQHKALLAGGDDYELCFTAPTRVRDAINALSVRLDLRLSRIGKIDKQPGLRLLDDEGKYMPTSPFIGFNHFPALST